MGGTGALIPPHRLPAGFGIGRAPAFRACEAALERLKRDAPIWKREVFEDGSAWVGMGP